ncbi:MAG: hypothetical protein QME51_08240 [Planctomycetota bacterium]|nr:hypothetical protein [Planctomycetota bacterium]MDI6788346.1 hypothetical protein [Planctomycetota bacterium]
MKEPEHIKKIHEIRERMSRRCDFNITIFAKMIRQAEIKQHKASLSKK